MSLACHFMSPCSGHTASCHSFGMTPAFPAPSAFLLSGVTHCPAPQDPHSMASPGVPSWPVSSLKSPKSTGRRQPTHMASPPAQATTSTDNSGTGALPAQGHHGQGPCSEAAACPQHRDPWFPTCPVGACPHSSWGVSANSSLSPRVCPGTKAGARHPLRSARRQEARGSGGAPWTLPGPPATGDSSPSPYLPEGGRPAAPSQFRHFEVGACSSLARPRDFFRDKAWLSQSSSSLSSDAPSWEGRLALAGAAAPSGGGFAPVEEGVSPAGAECRPGAGSWFSGGGTQGVEGAEPPLRGSLVGEGGRRSSSSSLRPNQSAPPFLGCGGLAVAGVLCVEPGSPLRSVPPSAKNLL